MLNAFQNMTSLAIDTDLMTVN